MRVSDCPSMPFAMETGATKIGGGLCRIQAINSRCAARDAPRTALLRVGCGLPSWLNIVLRILLLLDVPTTHPFSLRTSVTHPIAPFLLQFNIAAIFWI